MRIKLDKADKMFSRYIRLRDRRCVRCGRRGENDKKGDSIKGLQCSHFFGRGKESTRFDPDNCDALCFGCHRYWGSDDFESYRTFKIKQLGKKGFDRLVARANTPVKKDRKLAYIISKALYEKVKRDKKENL